MIPFRPLAATLIATVIATAAPAIAAAAPVAVDGTKVSAPAATDATPVATTAARKRTGRVSQARTNDPHLNRQWALKSDAPMGIQTAWRATTGGNVTVAVLDTGANLNHPDLRPNLWTNPGETAGTGTDGNGNGYADDVHGYDFVENNGNPIDKNGHGTHVAGIIGARGGNGIGGSGVAQNVRLMIVRVLDENANGTTDVVARGIHYAVDNGARIINLSLVGDTQAEDLNEALQYAHDHGVVVVTAAGNGGRDLGAQPAYPAALPLGNIIAVAATDTTGNLVSSSNHGAPVKVSAPGDDIYSTAMNGGYEWRTGTSMAAPAVSGTLALALSARPTLTVAEMTRAITAGARNTQLAVGGTLDAGRTLRNLLPASAFKKAKSAKSAKVTKLTATTRAAR